jgi:hypothetical protein
MEKEIMFVRTNFLILNQVKEKNEVNDPLHEYGPIIVDSLTRETEKTSIISVHSPKEAQLQAQIYAWYRLQRTDPSVEMLMEA